MRRPPKPADPRLQHAHVLYGWAEIAAYLRRSEATAQRWHKERALPITSIGYTVVIPKSALDLWLLAGRPQRAPRRRDVAPGESA